MARNSIACLLVGLGLISYSAPVVYAEDLDVKIDRMKIKEDKDDIADDRTNISKWQQIVSERKSMRDKAKGDYEGNLSKSGAKHKLTKEAKSRLDSAERSLVRAEKKLAKAQQSLNEDETELTQAYQQMSKDKD